MCRAIQIQLDLHMAPAWNMMPDQIEFYTDTKNIPGWEWMIALIDNDTNVPGALGYHQEIADKITGYVLVQPILDNGGTIMKFEPTNPGQYTVSGTLSHEVLETILDRFGSTWCDDANGTSWAFELADPCEQIGYGVTVDGQLIGVSDFVFPSFFNPMATLPQNAPFNYLQTIKTPFTILPGGYAIQRTGGPGTETQVFGTIIPGWRQAMKGTDLSRFGRRTK
jgi:hypothetical protein